MTDNQSHRVNPKLFGSKTSVVASVLFLIVFFLSFTTNAQYFNVNGDASDNGGGCYELTPFARQQTGSVWSPQKISLLNSFEVSGKMNFGLNLFTGADGIAFALQPVFNTATGTGSGLGVGYVAPSLIAEFDTYKNGYDPAFDHVSIIRDGVADHNAAGYTLANPVRIKNGSNNVKNGQWYNFKITWNATTQTLSVEIDCELRISYSGNIINDIFGGDPNVFWGFSAATGDKFNQHQVCIDASSLLKIDDAKICKGEVATISLPTTGTNYSLNSFTPTIGIVDASAPNPKFSPTTTTEYIVTYEGECNTELKDTFIVEIDDAPIVDLGSDTNSCDPNSILLDAQNIGDTYLWNTGATSQTITTNGIGNYDVKVTNATGCSGYDTISVGQNNSLSVNLGPDTAFCGAFNYTLDAQNSGSSYLWNNGSTGQNLTVNTTGIHSVIVTNPGGCVGKDTVIITTSTGPSVSLGADFSLCVGSDSSITATTNASNVRWSDGSTSKTKTLSSGINYIVQAWDNPACINYDTLSVLANCCTDSIITDDTLSVCLGDSLDIIAKDGKNLTWSSAEPWTEISNKHIKVSPASSGYYYVQSSNKGVNLITNGNFEGGNLGFSSDYTEDCTTSPMMRGGFCVGTNPVNHNTAWSACTDHSSGTGQMMIVDGAVTPNVKVWCQNVNTVENTAYEFSAWVSTIMPYQPAILQFSINGNLLGNNFTAPATACNWENFAAQWNSGSSTSAEICLINQSTLPDGNDFAIDDIEFVPICEEEDSVYVVVGTQLLVDLGPDTTLCGDSLKLSAGGSGLNYTWNTGETTESITVRTTGIYGVNLAVPNSTCKGSDSIQVTFSSPVQVQLPNDTVLCETDTLLIDASVSGYNYTWNTGENTQQIIARTSGKYFVDMSNAQNCSSSDSIEVTFANQPIVDLGGDSTFCSAVSFNLNANNNGATYLWNTGATSQSILATATGKFFVDVTNTQGCSNSDTIELSLHPNPTVNIGRDSAYCGNFSHTADAGNGFNSYLWNTGATSQSISITKGGTYFLDVIDVNGCQASDTITIKQSNGVPVNLGKDTSLCAGESITLNAGNHGVTYTWNTGQTTQLLTVNSAGTFSVIVKDPNNCQSKDTITIGINQLPIIQLPPDTLLCPNENLVVSTGNNQDNHIWSNGGTGATTTVSEAIQLSVTVTSPDNCTATGSVNITFDDLQLDLNAQFYHCSGASITLAPNSTQNGVNYSWNNVTNGSVFTTTTDGQYVLTATRNNCTDSKQTELLTVVTPTLSIVGDTIACQGESIALEAISSGTISWADGTRQNTLTVNKSGQYIATASGSNNGVTCSVNDTINTTFYDYPVEGEIEKFINCFNETPNFSIYTNTRANYYTWQQGTRENQFTPNAYFSVQKAGVYTVQIYNHPTCSVMEDIVVEDICPVYIYVPNAFTPDDDGLNDEFRPVVSNSIDYELVIMNRWGEVIFQTTNPDQGWNGVMNGNTVQTEVYVYRLKVTGYDQELREKQYVKTGTVTLVR